MLNSQWTCGAGKNRLSVHLHARLNSNFQPKHEGKKSTLVKNKLPWILLSNVKKRKKQFARTNLSAVYLIGQSEFFRLSWTRFSYNKTASKRFEPLLHLCTILHSKSAFVNTPSQIQHSPWRDSCHRIAWSFCRRTCSCNTDSTEQPWHDRYGDTCKKYKQFYFNVLFNSYLLKVAQWLKIDKASKTWLPGVSEK